MSERVPAEDGEYLQINLDPAEAQALRFVADLVGMTPDQWLRAATGSFRIVQAAMDDINAYFPEGSETQFRVVIEATSDDTSMRFAFTPNHESPHAKHVTILED